MFQEGIVKLVRHRNVTDAVALRRADYPLDDRTLDSDASIRKVDVFPTQSNEFPSSHAGVEARKDHGVPLWLRIVR